MSGEIIQHGPDIVKQNDRVAYTSAGFQTTESYVGRRAALEALQLNFAAQGLLCDLRPLGARHELTITYPFNTSIVTPADDFVEEIWTLRQQEYRRDLASHSFLDPLETDRAALLANADLLIREGRANELLDAVSPSPPEDDPDFLVAKYVKYRLLGTDYYVVYTPVVHRTIFAATRNTVRAEMPDSEIPKVIKSKDIDAPAGIMYAIPADWEWLDVPPSVDQTADRNRYRIEKDWIGAKQWADLYEGGTYTP